MSPNDASRSAEPVPVLTGSPILVVLRAMGTAGVHRATVVGRGAELGTVSEQDIRDAVRGGLSMQNPIDQVLQAIAAAGPSARLAPTAGRTRAELPDVLDVPAGRGVPFPRPRVEMDEEALPSVPLFDDPPAEAAAPLREETMRIPDPELVVPPRPTPAADRGPSTATRAPADRVAAPPVAPTPVAVTRNSGDEPPRVVVTGGAGYVGSVLVRQLLDEGFRVTVIDRMLYGSDYLELLEEVANRGALKIVEGDVRHIEEVEPHLRGATAVLHLADLDGIDLVQAEPEEALQTNVLATAALVQAASYLRVRRFVYASTTALYKPPRTATQRIDEDAPLHANTLYAKLKRSAETLVLDQAAPHFTPTVLRLGDIFGPSPRPRLDTVLNDVAMQAIRDVRVVLGAESHAIPAVHVEDAARAFLHVLGAPANHVAHQVFNVVGANVTVLALEQLLRDLVPEIRVLFTDAEPGTGEAVGRVSGEKAHKWLGFAPKQRFAQALEDLMAAIGGGYARDLPRSATHNVVAYERREAVAA
ncbi:MAG: NAD-dependent epimerase/dehydratase family protein [Bacteroidota bacterium]